MMNIEYRQRYNYWDLLGDVGGLNDGCFLLASILMSFYSAVAFRNDYLQGTRYENESDRRMRQFES